ncbi:hypothetical protein LJC68_01470 [Bacteroidales bacterium OttesenSCG-928-B11]|nr:hypothetical protein [Bacteroidales bacterium OttesenSCG-928-E04]MDL2308233.1 hypothetical protein [Bacteroidales bacterium OttesenSCG-928-C03]MDL2311533.1 hypothetical protein [Bacteroidales bacterium OttesenSCG-928-B11]MDL2325993.1 hypothetical protein [Bacteroidales bacterium OttesenSCG-928-A14]
MAIRNFRLLTLIIIALLFVTSCTKIEKEYDANGCLKSEVSYRFGKEHGKALYYENCRTRPYLEVEMNNGKKNGKLYRYFFNGNLETEASYVNDIQQGAETIFDLKGFKVIETHYVDGVKNGPYTTWHDRDMVKEKGAFKDGNFDGKWEYYDERGFMVGEGDFENGNGIVTAYDQAGNLYRITHYTDNIKDGDDTFYLPNGEVEKVHTYEKDKIVKINGESVSIDDFDEE